MEDPHPVYEQLRRGGPVPYDRASGEYWVLRRADAMFVLADRRFGRLHGGVCLPLPATVIAGASVSRRRTGTKFRHSSQELILGLDLTQPQRVRMAAGVGVVQLPIRYAVNQ